MKLFNTLTRKIEEFQPRGDSPVRIYSCGPTVYNYQHIGNYASYVYWDLLTRTLTGCGLEIKRVINLTDVGHLTSDGDSGEDKLEKGARREGKTVWEVADFYIEDFLKSYRSLNLTEPTRWTRATDFIHEQMALVDQLFERGFVYETKDGIYFEVAKFPKYADFARLDLSHLQAGARVEFSGEKRGVADFAVWKFIQPGEDHAMQWEYRGKQGYPGWHLECSTIIHEVLGEPIDIHTGGIDHIPVHHTNEIAQTEAAFGKPLARYWLHCNFITIDGEKISKSLGNVYTLADLAERGFAPLDYKMWVLQGHYQSERNFTFKDLAAARARRLRWRNAILAAKFQSEKLAGAANSENLAMEKLAEIRAALEDNLNSPLALSLIDQLPENTEVKAWGKIDSWLGLGLIDNLEDIATDEKNLIAEREAARGERNFARADEIRDVLLAHGIVLRDTPNGSIWERTN